MLPVARVVPLRTVNKELRKRLAGDLYGLMSGFRCASAKTEGVGDPPRENQIHDLTPRENLRSAPGRLELTSRCLRKPPLWLSQGLAPPLGGRLIMR
jgi:hypothetical protein